jgi:hypothetical protein
MQRVPQQFICIVPITSITTYTDYGTHMHLYLHQCRKQLNWSTQSKGDHDKAVQLYEKGGELSYAMSLCFKAGNEGRKDMFDILQKITDGLTTSDNSSNANPQVTHKI